MTFSPRTWVVGEVVSAALMNQEIRDQFNSMFSAWTTYTPTWTASTNPAIGNGSLLGRYLKIGRMVFVEINVIAGSTTTFGSGSYNWALPFTAANAGVSVVGHAHWLGTDRWQGQVVVSPNASSVGAFFNLSTTNVRIDFANATRPETATSATQIRLLFVYESAS